MSSLSSHALGVCAVLFAATVASADPVALDDPTLFAGDPGANTISITGSGIAAEVTLGVQNTTGS